MRILSIITIVVWLLVGFGYGNNVYRFCKLNFGPYYKAEIMRGIGIVIPPFGVILGFVDISDPTPSSTIESK